MEITLNKLLKLPNIKTLSEELKIALTDEEKRRNKFYERITPKDKAEFINGKPIFHSPVKIEHNEVGRRLLTLLESYVVLYSLGFVGYEKITLHFTRNSYQPDLCFFTSEQREKFVSEQQLFPPPTFVVEILSKSTAKRDRGIKFNDYAAHGVLEYWIIDPRKQTIEQYFLQKNEYKLLIACSAGIVKSVTVLGFQIEAEWLFNQTLYEAVFQNEQREKFALKSKNKEQEQLLQEKDQILHEQNQQLLEKEKLIQELLEKLNAK